MASTSNGSTIEYDPLKPVNEAVVEYRVIEDGALAHYLQEREIEHHHAQNVEQRRTVMGDIKTAKDLQDEEDRKARILTLDQQEELKDLDGQLAEVIQEELVQTHVKEEEERKLKEIRDNEIAKKITEREKRHYLRQQEQDRRLAEKMSDMRVSDARGGRHQPASDEEVARRIQEQERAKLKQKSENKEHIKTVIEMQDAELARFIHEKEMEEAEWIAERERRGKKKSGKKPHEPHPRYPPPEMDHRHYDPPEMRRSSKKGPTRPPQPQERSGETVSKAVPVRSAEIPLDRQRHSTREQPLQQHNDLPHGSSSERPRRPPQPKGYDPQASSTSRDHPDYRERNRDLGKVHKHSKSSDPRHLPRQRPPGKSGSREHLDQRLPNDRLRDSPSERSASRGHRSESSGDAEDSDNPWKRFPHGAGTPPGHPDDNIAYGEGFTRLTEQEAWNRDPKYRESAKRKNKGDCKQQ